MFLELHQHIIFIFWKFDITNEGLKMKKWSSKWTQFMQLRKEAWKKKKNSGLQRGLNPWPRDTGAMLYQLSYEATDFGSRSIVGSSVPVKEIFISFPQFIYDLFHISLTLISFTGTYEPTIDLLLMSVAS